MRHLCDTNVFLAAMIQVHHMHESARDWFSELSLPDTAEYCRASQNSILRLLVQEIAANYVPLTNDQAIDAFNQLKVDPRIRLAEEPDDIERDWLSLAGGKRSAPKLWMDAYLAAFARRSGMRFVTFDRGFRKFPGLDLALLT